MNIIQAVGDENPVTVDLDNYTLPNQWQWISQLQRKKHRDYYYGNVINSSVMAVGNSSADFDVVLCVL